MELRFVVDTTRLLVAAPPFLNKQSVASQTEREVCEGDASHESKGMCKAGAQGGWDGPQYHHEFCGLRARQTTGAAREGPAEWGVCKGTQRIAVCNAHEGPEKWYIRGMYGGRPGRGPAVQPGAEARWVPVPVESVTEGDHSEWRTGRCEVKVRRGQDAAADHHRRMLVVLPGPASAL